MQKLTGAQSRAQLIPQADMQNEIQVSLYYLYHRICNSFILTLCVGIFQRLETRIDMLETKLTSQEQSIISKTAERITATLPYGQQIAKLEQSIGMVVQNLQADILAKVTTLLTENIEVLLPDLPKMKEGIAKAELE